MHSETITSTQCISQATVKTFKPSNAALLRQIFHRLTLGIIVRLVSDAACLCKDEPVVFPPWNHILHHLPMACARCSGIVWAPVHLALTLCPWKPPVHLFFPPPFTPRGSYAASIFAQAFFFFLLFRTHLSLVSTSKQKRLSMDSVLRRMQDLSVRCVGPCRESEVMSLMMQSRFLNTVKQK